MLAESPKEASGSQARRRSEDAGLLEEDEELGRLVSVRGCFCCRRAM